MKLKLFILFLVGVLYVCTQATPVRAENPIRRELLTDAKKLKSDISRRKVLRERRERVASVQRFLASRQSPMAQDAESFISASERTGVSYKLLLAIANKESSLGKHIPPGSFNAFGWGIHQGRVFNSWSDGIQTVAEGLAANYDHTDIRRTIMKYAPPVENNTELYIAQVEQFIKSI